MGSWIGYCDLDSGQRCLEASSVPEGASEEVLARIIFEQGLEGSPTRCPLPAVLRERLIIPTGFKPEVVPAVPAAPPAFRTRALSVFMLFTWTSYKKGVR